MFTVKIRISAQHHLRARGKLQKLNKVTVSTQSLPIRKLVLLKSFLLYFFPQTCMQQRITFLNFHKFE